MLKRICCLLMVSVATTSVMAQYHVGKGTASIEPDSTIFSLALGGYGAPREGRFTLTWQPVAKYKPVKAITWLNGKFYAVGIDGKLVAGDTTQNATWQPVEGITGIVALTAGNNKLYAVNASNELFTLESSDGKWMNKGEVGYTIALAWSGNSLYGINDKQQLFVLEQQDTKPTVKIIGEAANAVSLAAKDNSLYALKNDNTIWKASAGNKIEWTKIARENGFSYNVPIKHIGIAGNRFFGMDVDGNIYLAGHSSRGDLTARALAIKASNNIAVIVGVDLVGIRYNVVDEVKNYIAKTKNIAPENILINISHTHFAPVSQSWPTWQPFNQHADSIYLYNIVKTGIIKAIEQSLSNMQAASLYFGRGSTTIGHNRSSEDLKTPYDDAVDVVKIKYASSSIPDILVLTGCHPVFPADNGRTYTISANYPGVMRRVLEEKRAAGTAFFLQGCAGDINPREANDMETGMALAFDAMSVLQGNMKKLSGKISCSMDTVNVPVQAMTRQEVVQFKNQNLNKEGDVWAEKNVRWADLMLERYRQNKVATHLPVYVQTINIGNWKLVGLSREVVTDYSLGIKKLWPEKIISVAGYCNDVSSYLPVKSHITRHTYEGDDSSFWYGEPALFPANVLELVLEQIKKNGK